MQYAYSVASLIINDHFIRPASASTAASDALLPQAPEEGLPDVLLAGGAGGEGSGKRVVEMKDWERIDAAEVERGRKEGKPREKFLSVREMLEVLP
jgi:adrenodoxin-NADP+ reductase